MVLSWNLTGSKWVWERVWQLAWCRSVFTLVDSGDELVCSKWLCVWEKVSGIFKSPNWLAGLIFLCFVECIVIKLEPKPAVSIQINYTTFMKYKISEEISRTPHLKRAYDSLNRHLVYIYNEARCVTDVLIQFRWHWFIERTVHLHCRDYWRGMCEVQSHCSVSASINVIRRRVILKRISASFCGGNPQFSRHIKTFFPAELGLTASRVHPQAVKWSGWGVSGCWRLCRVLCVNTLILWHLRYFLKPHIPPAIVPLITHTHSC